MSKDMDEHLKLAQEWLDVKDGAKKDLCDSAAVNCGQAREFLWQLATVCNEKGVLNFSTGCLREA